MLRIAPQPYRAMALDLECTPGCKLAGMSTMSPAGLSIGEAAAATGIPTETHYDRAGLLGELARDAGGRRVFDEAALGLLDVVLRLRRTGMPIGEVRRFVGLIPCGDAEIPARLALLREHRDRVSGQLTQLTDDLAVIDWKIAAYSATAAGRPVPAPPPGWPDVTPVPDLQPGQPVRRPTAEGEPG